MRSSGTRRGRQGLVVTVIGLIALASAGWAGDAQGDVLPPAGRYVAAGGYGTTGSSAVRYYRVAKSFHGQQEFLYEIAERFLGDGDRFPAIFALNRNRLQPDGGRLTDPTELETGWLLILPADARGAGIIQGPLPCCADPTGSSSATPTESSAPGVGAGAPQQSSGPLGPSSSSADPARSPISPVSLRPASSSAVQSLAGRPNNPKPDGSRSTIFGAVALVVAVLLAAAFVFWSKGAARQR
ncbi:MAG: peptidoglycan-binding LysM [Frankiales bacterium]|nr:peptidoglycan-binding LysM [Frankiales bacterium]